MPTGTVGPTPGRPGAASPTATPTEDRLGKPTSGGGRPAGLAFYAPAVLAASASGGPDRPPGATPATVAAPGPRPTGLAPRPGLFLARPTSPGLFLIRPSLTPMVVAGRLGRLGVAETPPLPRDRGRGLPPCRGAGLAPRPDVAFRRPPRHKTTGRPKPPRPFSRPPGRPARLAAQAAVHPDGGAATAVVSRPTALATRLFGAVLPPTFLEDT